ncbi:MAG: acetylornithine deacetylase [Gemmatimonadales bacterium]|nr:MAG: acetylornithine deacetylase [Gemmatimonadales bacterium]
MEKLGRAGQGRNGLAHGPGGGQTSPVPLLLDDTEILRRLVAFDSVSRNSNLPIADFIADYLDRPGVRVRRNPSADARKPNLIIHVGPETDPYDRAGLVLSGHMDVVPADEPQWESDPFTLTDRGDAHYGRGTADMKGFLALAMNRLATIDLNALRHPLALLFTYDEELGTLGAERFAKTWPAPEELPRAVIIGEPTSLHAVRTHKGHLQMRLIFPGVSAHSGYPHLGRNAIEPAGRAIASLTSLRHELEAERPDNADLFPEVPFVALNVGTIAGGSAVNVVPDQCVVQIGLRVLPGLTGSDLVARVTSHLETAMDGEAFSIEVIGDSPPFMLDRESVIHHHGCEVVGQADSGSVAFATDAGWLQTVGFECLILGPGTIEVAHKPNESIPIEEFRKTVDVLDRLVRRFCLEPRTE